MVTYMDPQTAPSYMSATCVQQTLHIQNFTHKPHAQPSLSYIPKWDSNFGEPSHSRRTTRLEQNFPTSPQIKIPNLHIVRYMCQFEQYLSHRQNERHTHPSWAPTKDPTMSCWRYTPSSNLDRFQDFLEAICPDF